MEVEMFKKLFSFLFTSIFFVSAWAMEEKYAAMQQDDPSVEQGLCEQYLAQQQAMRKREQEKRTQDYKDLKAVVEAIQQPDNKKVEQLLSEKQWKNSDIVRLISTYKAQLKNDFDGAFGNLLGGQWPFHLIWLALELVIKSKQGQKEAQAVYQQRLSILTILGKDRYAIQAQLVLRKNRPACTCAWLLSCFCCPCICACSDVHGYPIHRAAQTDNTDALEVLIPLYIQQQVGAGNAEFCNINTIKDSADWGPFQYAVFYGKENAAAYLRGWHGAGVKKSWYRFCEDPRFLAKFTDNKNVKQLITDGSSPMCCDGCI